MAELTKDLLGKYVGKDIAVICKSQFIDSSFNHCAHFVCHVLQLRSGYLCSQQSGSPTKGVGIRVHELFSTCPKVGEFDDRGTLTQGLVFVIKSGLVDLPTQEMQNVPKKHIGIYIGDTIWHYSNTADRVVTTTPTHFKTHYSGQLNTLYFGEIPASASAIEP